MNGLCSLPLPHGAMGWSVECDYGICWSSDRYPDSGQCIYIQSQVLRLRRYDSYWKSGQ